MFIFLAAKGLRDDDGVEHDSCLNPITLPWRGILFCLVVYCAGQEVWLCVARAGQGRVVRVHVTDFSGTCIIDPPLKASRTWGSIKNDLRLVFELIPAILGY